MFLVNLFTLPATEAQLFARPRIVYDSFDDLARAAMFALGREPRIVFTPMPATLRDKYQYYTRASMQRLRDAGYRAGFTSLEDGVGDYVRNFLARDDPYR